MRGASRWLEALAVGTPGERSSAPRPSAAHAPMTDRDGALPCNFMCPSFRPPTLRTHAPERISAAPPGPFAPLPAHQYLPGSDDRGRCSVKRTAIILAAALAVTTAGCGRGDQETAPAPSERPAIRSVRITMAALHQAGGVPPGWRFTVPPGDVGAGRRTFADAGCPSCHRVAREAFPPPTGPGPELTGMGSHHPAEYFVESILTPDAVLVDGPGYIGPDGHSAMPSYPDLTLRQLADLVAYLKSLTAGGAREMLTAAPPAPVIYSGRSSMTSSARTRTWSSAAPRSTTRRRCPRPRVGACPETAVHGSGGTVSARIRRRRTRGSDRPCGAS